MPTQPKQCLTIGKQIYEYKTSLESTTTVDENNTLVVFSPTDNES